MKKLVCTVIFLLLMYAAAEIEITAPDVIMSGCLADIYASVDGSVIEADWTVSDERYLKCKNNGTLTGENQTERAIEVVLSCTYSGMTSEKTITVVPAATSFIINRDGVNCPNTVIRIGLGDQICFGLSCKPDSAAAAAEWTSSDESIAVVDKNGVVSGIGTGSAEITAKLPSGRYTHCTVMVYLEPEYVSLPENIEISVGAALNIQAVVFPEGADMSALKWTSSDSRICEVNSKGRLTANSTGTAQVTCTAPNGNASTVIVEVYRGVSEVSAKRKGIKLAVNSTFQLEFEVKPAGAKYQELVYYSTDPDVAVVDENGMVTGIKDGNCRIYAEEKDGKKAYTDVSVVYIRLEKAELESGFMTVRIGENKALKPVFTPENASDKNVTYEISDENVAIVSDGVLTGVTKGRCELRVFVNGVQTDKATVRVINEDSLPLEGIKIGVNPGHQISLNLAQKPIRPGSSETGNANSGYAVGIVTYIKEYEVTLSVGLYMRDILESMGAEVVMTRTENDVHINNIERAIMLNEAGVDFAIQLHCDNNPSNHSVTGMSMFVKSKDYESREIAEIVLEAACAETGAKNRSVRWYDRYMSLNYSETPAALIEMGYLSTPDDDLLLSDDAYRFRVAQGICNGILEYYSGK